MDRKTIFSKINPHLLEKIIKGIFEKKYLKVYYFDHWKEIAPIKIFLYQGILYISAINEENKKISLKFSCIKDIIETDKKVHKFYIREYRKQNFGFEDELPFIFAVDIPKGYIWCEDLNNTKLLNTQFYAEENGENIKVYLIGYTGWRFPSRMFVPHIEKIYKPDEEMLETAKRFKKQLKETTENISFSLKENTKRFSNFIDNYKYYLKQRVNLLEKLR